MMNDFRVFVCICCETRLHDPLLCNVIFTVDLKKYHTQILEHIHDCILQYTCTSYKDLKPFHSHKCIMCMFIDK